MTEALTGPEGRPAAARLPALNAPATGAPARRPGSSAAKPSFNLSSWTLRHQPLVIFLLVLLTVFGILSYGRLAQSEDPPFTF